MRKIFASLLGWLMVIAFILTLWLAYSLFYKSSIETTQVKIPKAYCKNNVDSSTAASTEQFATRTTYGSVIIMHSEENKCNNVDKEKALQTAKQINSYLTQIQTIGIPLKGTYTIVLFKHGKATELNKTKNVLAINIKTAENNEIQEALSAMTAAKNSPGTSQKSQQRITYAIYYSAFSNAQTPVNLIYQLKANQISISSLSLYDMSIIASEPENYVKAMNVCIRKCSWQKTLNTVTDKNYEQKFLDRFTTKNAIKKELYK